MNRHVNLTCPYQDCRRQLSLPIESTSIICLSGLREPSFGTRISWGFCTACQRIIILTEQGTAFPTPNTGGYFDLEVRLVILFPPEPARSLSDPDIPQLIREEFNEAAAVLLVSAKASAALSRRILQHVLRENYGLTQRDLAVQIDEFLKLRGIPSTLTGAIDGIRQFGNFAAHTMKDKNTGEIVDVEPGEAEWSLDVLESLFDFTFVQPARLAAKRADLNKKLTAAGKPSMK